MMNSTMQPIHSLIDPKIVNRAQNIQRLTTSLRSRLPSNLKNHCWVVDIIGNQLVCVANNAETASILRYQQHELLKQINEEFSQSLLTKVRRIKISVDYNLNKSQAYKQKNVIQTDTQRLRLSRLRCQQILRLLD